MDQTLIDDGGMRADWNARAREDAKWYINCVRQGQTEEEFDATGLVHARGFVIDELDLLIGERDPARLKMLEIGCGIGRMTRHFAAVFGEVHGTDVSDEMIRLGKIRLAGSSNVHLTTTNGVDFSEFNDGEFDFVFSAYVFQHIGRKEAILSNIRDGYRVLKPGCLFKFLVSSVDNKDFVAAEKDNWSGSTLSEEELRRVATDLEAEVVRLTDPGTQHCWVMLRKPLNDRVTELGDSLELLECGRVEDLADRTVSHRGKGVGLLLKGLAESDADTNTLLVEIDGYKLRPSYVGPTRGWGSGTTQVSVSLPAGVPPGPAEVRLVLPDGRTTGTRTIRITDDGQAAPVVTLATNCLDGSMSLATSGTRSRIGLHTLGLEGVKSVRVRIGCEIIDAEEVRFAPSNGNWVVVMQVPKNVQPGRTEVAVIADTRESAAFEIELEA